MSHSGTYDFAPETAPLDDQIMDTVDEFRCDCRSAVWNSVVTYFWAVTLGMMLGTIAWWGVVSAG